MGIDTDRVYAVTWAVGIACVGAAGVLLAPIYPVYPTAGLQFVLIAYVAVVLGGLGDMAGALIAALVVAAVEVIGSYVIGTAWKEVLYLAAVHRHPRRAARRALRAARRRGCSARERASRRPPSSSPVAGLAPLVVRDAFLLDSLVLILDLGDRRGRVERGRRLRRSDLARPLGVLRAGRLCAPRSSTTRWELSPWLGLRGRRARGDGRRARHRVPLEPAPRPVLRARDHRVLAGAARRRQPLARLHRRLRRASPSRSVPGSGPSASRTSGCGSGSCSASRCSPTSCSVYLERSRRGYQLAAVREDEDAALSLGVPARWLKVAAISRERRAHRRVRRPVGAVRRVRGSRSTCSRSTSR